MSTSPPASTSGYRIVDLPPDQLKPNPRNPRVHNKRHIKQLAKSMTAFGFAAPILVSVDNEVIAGHGRLEAAKLLNMATVPTISLAHLSDQQRDAYMVADNRLNELSSWDWTALASVMLDLSEADLSFDLDAVGFSVAEIDLMISLDDPGQDRADEIPDPGPAIAAAGDV